MAVACKQVFWPRDQAGEIPIWTPRDDKRALHAAPASSHPLSASSPEEPIDPSGKHSCLQSWRFWKGTTLGSSPSPMQKVSCPAAQGQLSETPISVPQEIWKGTFIHLWALQPWSRISSTHSWTWQEAHLFMPPKPVLQTSVLAVEPETALAWVPASLSHSSGQSSPCRDSHNDKAIGPCLRSQLWI